MKKSLLTIASVSLLTLVAVVSLVQAKTDEKENNKSEREIVHSVGTTMEVHLSDNGRATVRGARVTALSSTTVTAVQTWGSYTQTWNVVIDSSTEFVRRNGGKASLSEIVVGDYISFSGTLDTTKTQSTVNADVIKDWSAVKPAPQKTTYEGKVTSIATSTSSFGFVSGGIDYTVSVPANISIINKNWQTIPFSSIKVNDQVRVYGALAATTTKIINATVVRDTSI